VAGADYKDLTMAEREECAQWIEDNSIPGVDVNLRTLIHVMDCRSFDPERWRELASDFVDAGEELMMVHRLLDECATVSQAAQEYMATTGKSERSFYNKKRVIHNDGGGA